MAKGIGVDAASGFARNKNETWLPSDSYCEIEKEDGWKERIHAAPVEWKPENRGSTESSG